MVLLYGVAGGLFAVSPMVGGIALGGATLLALLVGGCMFKLLKKNPQLKPVIVPEVKAESKPVQWVKRHGQLEPVMMPELEEETELEPDKTVPSIPTMASAGEPLQPK